MRRLISLAYLFVLSAVLALTLCGCFGSTGSSDSGSSSNAATTSASASSAATNASPTGANSSQASSGATVSTASGPTVSGDSYAEKHDTGIEYVAPDITVKKDGEYTDKDHVALYIHKFGTVPGNYVTKTKARKAGWVNTKGNLWDVLPGKSIGGGGFYNDDNTMPDAPGREWFECDIDYEGGFRNAKRIVYSDDGLIYYTDDHYNTFQRLY